MRAYLLIQHAEQADIHLPIERGRMRWRASHPPSLYLLATLKASPNDSAQGPGPQRLRRLAPQPWRGWQRDGLAASPSLLPTLPFRSPRTWPAGSLEARAVRYLNEAGAKIIPGQDGWLYVTLPDERFVYLAPAVQQRIGWAPTAR